MECARNFGGREVEGIFELLFRDSQHSFHPRRGAVFSWRFFKVFKNLADELRVLNRRGPHRTSKLTIHSQTIELGTRVGYKLTYMKG